MKKVKEVSAQIAMTKKEVFDDFKSITELKAELYGVMISNSLIHLQVVMESSL